MLDLVARGDILDALIEKGQKSKRYKWGESWELNLSEIKEAVESVPSAEPEQNRGELKTVGFFTSQCSECKAQFHELEYTNYCPNCGTKWEESQR